VIDARIGDAAIPLAGPETAQHRWLLPLRSRHLPQRVEVVYAGTHWSRNDGRADRLEAPGLASIDRPDVALPTDRTLWTVVHAPQFAPDQAGGQSTSTALEQELVRLRHLTALLRMSSQRAAEAPRDLDRWYRVWARRWVASESQVRRELAGGRAPADRDAAVAELDALREAQEEIARQRDAADVVAELSALPALADGPVALWRGSYDRQSVCTRVICGAEGALLSVKQKPTDVTPHSRRLLAALGIGTVALALVVVLCRLGGLALLRRWPRVAGVAVGLAWWLWLKPSILGLAIVALSLLVVRRAKAGPQRPASPSTIAVYPRQS
jgi:hypothetical protein